MSSLWLWLAISLHSLKLTGRALLRSSPWLLVAPGAALVNGLLSRPLSALGIVGGFLRGFVIAGLLSLVLYVGRCIIEQRRLRLSDLSSGLGAFFGDVMNVLFAVWIVSLLGALLPAVTWAVMFALVVLPVLTSA